MINIRIEYGTRHITTEVEQGTTVGNVINNSNFKAILLYDNVSAYVNGAAVGTSYVLEDGDVVKLQAAAQTKN